MEQLKLLLIGAGERGAHCYAPYALKYPQEVAFVGVAEPNEARRNAFAEAHGLAPESCFADWPDLLAAGIEADGVIVATQDRQHYEPVLAGLRSGLHVLCEKPMAETYEKSLAMVQAAEAANRLLMVCHVLRYTPFYRAVKAVIDGGRIGDTRAVHHLENIGNWHFAHSYVRGNWRNSAQSTPMIVAKCSHDMDILNFLLGKRCARLSSFGSLSFFTAQNAPPGAAARCSECPLNKNCNFSAYHYYEARDTYAPFRGILEHTTGRPLGEMLEDSAYNRCVYHCDNDVPDRQSVMMAYEDGLTVTFTASAFSADISRQTKIMGTLGEIEGRLEDNAFLVRDFGSGQVDRVQVQAPPTTHAGGDERIMAHFCTALRDPAGHPEVDARLSLAGHAMAFAAEKSRLAGGRVVELESWTNAGGEA
ncbi:Gfo/Idh/MocA family oxidoreductase [Ruminococcaceae bacterium OttesenSCG-928-D13]|nr:Gfo/Idh/MocA family oxidoreductase [Ruminococcaceae bacterium OttesenSCG-928-D13]